MSKLYRARSLLYRRQILQVNIRWKALDEIYKIYMLLHRSDLNISEKNRQTFSHFFFRAHFSAKFCKIYQFRSKTCLVRSCHAEEEEQAPLGVRGISTESIVSNKESR